MKKPRYRVAAHADGRVTDVRLVDGAGVRMGASAGFAAVGGYEGAQRQRRLASFRTSEASINALIVSNGQTLRARGRYLVRNNPYARKAKRVFITNLVGTGVRPVPLGDDAKIKLATADLWDEWCEECDADELVDFYGIQALIAGAIFEAGECFVRFRPRYARDGLSVPLQLQVLESEFCPYELNMVADNGNVVRAGVEFDKIGKRVAYYFWRTHPGEFSLLNLTQVGYTRVPASEVLHLFEPLRPGQIRGVSWVAAAIVRAWLLDQYDDAELARKQTAALFAGFITRPDNTAEDAPISGATTPPPGVSAGEVARAADRGEDIVGLSPGMLQELAQGEDIKFAQPADVGPNFEAFQYRALLAMTAGMDMPYSNVTGDFSKANYSSERARMLDLRASLKQVQRIVIAFQFCKRVFKRFVSDAVLSGSLKIRATAFNASPRSFNRADWIPPAQDWVNPKDDMAAEESAMRNGVESREAVVMRRSGKTLEQMDAAIARSNASADAYGLVLDSDPRRTNMRGSAPPPDTTAPVETETPPPSGDDQTDGGAQDEEAAA